MDNALATMKTASTSGSKRPTSLVGSVLRMDLAGTFSDLWYRVGPTRARLSPYARVTRQLGPGSHWYIIEEPAGGSFYRLTPAGYLFVGLLDGRRTVDDAWQACNAQLGDEGPTQRECIDILAKLQFYGLLSGEQPLSPDMIQVRRDEAQNRRMRRRASGLSLVVPLVNPERALAACEWLLRPLFSRVTLALFGVLVSFALYRIFIARGELASQFNSMLDPGNVPLVLGLLVLIRAWHELGHACATKAMGGRCSEIGIILMAYVFPFPYCDTSSAWRFPEVWRRVVVSSGGMLFELTVAAAAAIVWSYWSEPNAVRSLLYTTMVLSGITTILFNLNPLLRYDGYYILADVTGSPNLAQRGIELWKFVVQRRVFGVAGAKPPTVRSAGEFWLLFVHAGLAFPYRIFVLFFLVGLLWTSTTYLTLGALLAIAGVCVWLIWPAMKGVGWLFSSPTLVGKRSRSLALTGAVVGAIALFVLVVPMPAASYASGVVEAAVSEPIRPAAPGVIAKVLVRAGQRVTKGTPLFRLDNPDLIHDLAQATARLAQAKAVADVAAAGSPTDRIVAERRADETRAELERVQVQVDGLSVLSRSDGVVVMTGAVDSQMLVGRFVDRGALLGMVEQLDALTIRAILSDREHAHVFRGLPAGTMVRASARLRGQAGRVVPLTIAREGVAGSQQGVPLALTTQGGGDVLLDPNDTSGTTTVTPQFVLEMAPESQAAVANSWRPGLRAVVRFATPATPLASQWYRRLRQYLSEKATI